MEHLDVTTDSAYQYQKWDVISRGCRHEKGRGRLGLRLLSLARGGIAFLGIISKTERRNGMASTILFLFKIHPRVP
jgi:hypothetical protein